MERINPSVLYGMRSAVTTENLLKLRPPTLFAIGSQSRLSTVSEMEKVRLEMQARNKLVIVRNADEALRIPLSKRMKVKLTQARQATVTRFSCLLCSKFKPP